jgi:hypothetical protein
MSIGYLHVIFMLSPRSNFALITAAAEVFILAPFQSARRMSASTVSIGFHAGALELEDARVNGGTARGAVAAASDRARATAATEKSGAAVASAAVIDMKPCAGILRSCARREERYSIFERRDARINGLCALEREEKGRLQTN